MPEWVIYKNDQRIGQAITWSKAFDILIKREGISQASMDIYSRYVTVKVPNNENSYKMVKER